MPRDDKLEFTAKSLIWDILFDIAGGLLIAAGAQCFSAPAQIAPGGVSGIAIIVNYLTDVSISLLVFVVNIPLLLLALKFLGRRFAVKTVISTAIMSLMLEIVARTGLFYTGETMLSALYAGILMGAGCALVFMRSSSTGGSDIVARLIQRGLPNLPVGRILLGVDALVLISAALVFRNVESALFALITIFVSTRVVDSILYGLDMGKVLMIVTNEESAENISAKIFAELDRGCTVLEARGSFTRADKPVLLCAVRASQVYEVKQIAYQIDPGAFIMAMEANEVIGEGFKPAGTAQR
ncbi:MAG: YitT family protein [Oscillospiraceae bacterium]|jgi:uncharacterized membrane-anchored protein YitT (DUF2179 family)|nr:YitT family protein [Oscillospiraceae bacterium]